MSDAMSVRTMIGGNRVIPVVKIEDADRAADLVEALRLGGITVVEITFRTAAAGEAILRCRKAQSGSIVGAGTVRTIEQVDQALDKGAQFLVSPGFNPAIVEYAIKKGVPHIPGAITPSEIEQAADLGLRELKFFPAEAAGGVPFLKSLVAVYPEIAFMPTGGITTDNLGAYLALKNVLACGGSWMVQPEWIANGQFDRIRDTAEAAVEMAG